VAPRSARIVTLDHPHTTRGTLINTPLVNPQMPIAVLALILVAWSGLSTRDEATHSAGAAPGPSVTALPAPVAGSAEPKTPRATPRATGGAVLHTHALRADGH
jgi:hypothetical protein